MVFSSSRNSSPFPTRHMELCTFFGFVWWSLSSENGFTCQETFLQKIPLLFSLMQVIIAVCSFPEFSNDTVSTFTQHREVHVNCPHTKEVLAMWQTWGIVFTFKYSFVYDNDDNLCFSFNYQNFCNKNVLFCNRYSSERNSFSPVVRILLRYCSTNYIYSLEIISVHFLHTK